MGEKRPIPGSFYRLCPTNIIGGGTTTEEREKKWTLTHEKKIPKKRRGQ